MSSSGSGQLEPSRRSARVEPSPRSARVELARVAAEVLTRTPGTALTAGAGGRWSTVDGEQRIHGVVAAAAPGGRVELELHLIVDWPPGPLGRLADEVRGRVSTAAELAGLQPSLGAIQIRFEDVNDPRDAQPRARVPTAHDRAGAAQPRTPDPAAYHRPGAG